MHKNYTLNILAKLGGTRYMTFDLKLVFVFELQCIIKILKGEKPRDMLFVVQQMRKNDFYL